MGEMSNVTLNTIEEFNWGYAGAHTLLLERRVRENGGRQDDFCIVCLKRPEKKNLFPQQGPKDIHFCSRQFCNGCISPFPAAKYADNPIPARYKTELFQTQNHVAQLCPLCQKRGWELISPFLGVEAPGWSRKSKEQARMMQCLRFETLPKLKKQPYGFGRWNDELDDGSLESDRALLMMMMKQWKKRSPRPIYNIYFRSRKTFAKLTDVFSGGLIEGPVVDADMMLDASSEDLIRLVPILAPAISTDVSHYESKDEPCMELSDSKTSDCSENRLNAGLSGDGNLNTQPETHSATPVLSGDEEFGVPSESDSDKSALGGGEEFDNTSEPDSGTPIVGEDENLQDAYQIWKESNSRAEESLKILFNRRDKTIDGLRGRISRLESELVHNHSEETEQLRSRISLLKSELGDSSSCLTRVEDAKKVLEKRNQELVSDSEHFQKKLDQFETDRENADQLKSNMAHHEKENEILQTKCENTEHELVQQRDLATAAEKSCSEMRAQLKRYQKVARQCKIEIGRLEKENEELKTQHTICEDDMVHNRELDLASSQTALENIGQLENLVSMEEKFEEEITTMKDRNADLSRDCASLAYKLAKSRRLKFISPESFASTFLIFKVAEAGTIDRLKENPDFIDLLMGKLSRKTARIGYSGQKLQPPSFLQDSQDFNMRPKTGRSANLSEGSGMGSPTASGKRNLTPDSIEEDGGSLADEGPKRRCLN